MKTSLPVTTVATINKQNIIVIENGEKRVAVKPICQALGVNYTTQLERLQNDPILKDSVVPLKGITGSDGKQYEMVTIPFKYVFGWLFRIDSRNVKPEASETVLKYQVECYDVLYSHFTGYAEFVEFKQNQVDEKLEALKQIRADFNYAKESLRLANEELELVRKITYSDYKQLKLDFPEEQSFSDNEKGVSDE